MQSSASPRILVTGATGFLGYRVLVALLESGAKVTAMARADRVEKLTYIEDRINITVADVWNRASLKGRARNHNLVIHLVGSPHVDPQRGLTYDQVNLVSARNAIGMAVTDGVPHVILLSTVVRPGDLPGAYVRSKRDAEIYLRESGVAWTIVRAPALFAPRQSAFLGLTSALGGMLPINLLLGRYLPLSVDTAARGISGIALRPFVYRSKTVYARTLRREAYRNRRNVPLPVVSDPSQQAASSERDIEEAPFGWIPPAK